MQSLARFPSHGERSEPNLVFAARSVSDSAEAGGVGGPHRPRSPSIEAGISLRMVPPCCQSARSATIPSAAESPAAYRHSHRSGWRCFHSSRGFQPLASLHWYAHLALRLRLGLEPRGPCGPTASQGCDPRSRRVILNRSRSSRRQYRPLEERTKDGYARCGTRPWVDG